MEHKYATDTTRAGLDEFIRMANSTANENFNKNIGYLTSDFELSCSIMNAYEESVAAFR